MEENSTKPSRAIPGAAAAKLAVPAIFGARTSRRVAELCFDSSASLARPPAVPSSMLSDGLAPGCNARILPWSAAELASLAAICKSPHDGTAQRLATSTIPTPL